MNMLKLLFSYNERPDLQDLSGGEIADAESSAADRIFSTPLAAALRRGVLQREEVNQCVVRVLAEELAILFAEFFKAAGSSRPLASQGNLLVIFELSVWMKDLHKLMGFVSVCTSVVFAICPPGAQTLDRKKQTNFTLCIYRMG